MNFFYKLLILICQSNGLNTTIKTIKINNIVGISLIILKKLSFFYYYFLQNLF